MHEHHHEHHEHHPPHHAMVQANPGSAGWAAGAAFAGRVIGGLPGLIVAAATAKETAEGEAPEPSYAGGIIRWLGQIGGAAGGAALGAPEGLKGRAAVGAAIGGAVPFIGAPLAAVGAYVATRPKGRSNNPYEQNPSPMTWVGVALGVAVVGAGTYFGVKALKKRQEEAGNGNGNGNGNLDDWGWDLDQYSHWGAGPATGQDGQEYAYVIYHDATADQYWVDFRGPGDEGPDDPVGPFATSAEAETYVETQLPAT